MTNFFFFFKHVIKDLVIDATKINNKHYFKILLTTTNFLFSSQIFYKNKFCQYHLQHTINTMVIIIRYLMIPALYKMALPYKYITNKK